MSELIDKDLAIAAIRKKLKGLPITVMTLPAEQPEKRTDKRTETHARDCISRQAAIDALYKHFDKMIENGHRDNALGVSDSIFILGTLPSAQPDQTKMIKEIRKWITSGNRGSADYFIVDKIEEIINKYE